MTVFVVGDHSIEIIRNGVLGCRRRGGRLRLVALIEQPSVTQRILRHIELPTDAPESGAARATTIPAKIPPDHVPQFRRRR